MKPISNSAICINCGSGHKSRPFCTYENGVHCFACGYTLSYDRGYSISSAKLENNIVDFPECTNNISEYTLESLEWLTKYGIYEPLIYKHKILSRVSDGALVFLNIKDNEVVCYQTRDKDRQIRTYGTKSSSIIECKNTTNTCVIVEDFISAIRVSKFVDACCLWGIKIHYPELEKLCRKYDNIFVWLDNDTEKDTNSGQEAAEKIIRTINNIYNRIANERGFSLLNKTVSNIISKEDPKFYLDNEIEQYINININVKAAYA